MERDARWLSKLVMVSWSHHKFARWVRTLQKEKQTCSEFAYLWCELVTSWRSSSLLRSELARTVFHFNQLITHSILRPKLYGILFFRKIKLGKFWPINSHTNYIYTKYYYACYIIRFIFNFKVFLCYTNFIFIIEDHVKEYM